MDEKKALVMKYAFGAVLLILGVVFNFMNIGKNTFMGYGTVGNYLIFCGLFLFIILIIKSFRKGKAQADERATHIALKASRLTFVFMIVFAFVVMIIDGIRPMQMQYSQFMSYFICSVTLFFFASYKIMLKYN